MVCIVGRKDCTNDLITLRGVRCVMMVLYLKRFLPVRKINELV